MLKQDIELKQLQKLSPQQIQLMKLVQLPTFAFEQRVEEELEENPALEGELAGNQENEQYEDHSDEYNDDYYEDTAENKDKEEIILELEQYMEDDEIPLYKTQSNNYGNDEFYEVPYAQGISFQEYLKDQVHTFKLSEEEEIILDFIIGNLDDDGYMRRDLKSIVDDLAFTQGIYTTELIVYKLLTEYIQKLDPIGVGARDLRECLLIQLEAKNQTKDIKSAIFIIEKMFDAFTKKHYDKIKQKLNIFDIELKEIINQILKLNPKPGKVFNDSSKNIEEVIPDFNIKIVGGELELTLNGRNAPDLKISKNYQQILETYKESDKKSKQQKETMLFVKQKLDSAKWFIDAVKERQNTLYITMHAIMEFQKEYLLTGDESNIKPMILKNISDITGMDISTVSRVANSKYASTPYGTMLIKNLFSESLTNDEGEEVSSREVKTILKEIIESEDPKNPYTDDTLNKLLKERGYSIARRTIAKYREQMNIPVARLRKNI